MPRLIFYADAPAVLAGTTRMWFAPPLDELPLEHPVCRFVSWMAIYSHQIDRGALVGPYTQEDAERYARGALIDDDAFDELRELDDEFLAAYFAVPVEQIAKRREDARLGSSAADES